MNDNLQTYVSIDALLLVAMIMFLFGAAFKTCIDSCLYRMGVRHGYRVAKGDVDTELDEAREMLHFQCKEDAEHEV